MKIASLPLHSPLLIVSPYNTFWVNLISIFASVNYFSAVIIINNNNTNNFCYILKYTAYICHVFIST